MKIETIGDLKKAIAELQAETKLGDDAPVCVAVRSYTQVRPSGYPKIWDVSTTSGGEVACLCVTLPEGFSIHERKTKREA